MPNKVKKVVVKAVKAKKSKNKKSAPMSMTMRSVVKAVKQHAEMIMDPCNAFLVHPLYAGGGSGTLVRVSSAFSIGTTALATTCGVQWTPGAFFGGTGTNPVLLSFDNAGLTATCTPVQKFGNCPGQGQLTQATVGKYRCIGACMALTPNASVMNRAGHAYFGLTEGTSMVQNTGAATFNASNECVQLINKTDGANTFEVIWRPDFADQQYVDPTTACATAAIAAVESASHQSICAIIDGYPAATGYTVKLTAIYEIEYSGQNGTGFDMSRQRAVGTLDNVLDYIEDVGFKYVTAMGGPMAGAAFHGITTMAKQVYRN